jgi:hypothetical protein
MNKAKIIISQTEEEPPSSAFAFTLYCSCCGTALDCVSYQALKGITHIYQYCPYCWTDFAGIVNNTDIGFDDSYVTGES